MDARMNIYLEILSLRLLNTPKMEFKTLVA